jgi:hypothetical protein
VLFLYSWKGGNGKRKRRERQKWLQIKKNPSHLTHFDFEGDTNDSDYFLVKRIEVVESSYSNLFINQQTIKILPNAEIHLTIQVHDVTEDQENRVMEIKLCNIKNITDDNDLHIEISLHVLPNCIYSSQQNIDVNFTKTLLVQQTSS